MLLGVAGLFAATFLYMWGVQLLEKISLPIEVPFVIRAELNWRMAVYSAVLALGTAVFCSLGPAIKATRANVSATLKDEMAAAAAGVFSFRNLLVIGQVSVSLLLLVTSFLFVRSLRDVQNADPGFNVANQLVAQIQFDDSNKTVKQEILERLRTIAGVRSVSLAALVPLSGHQWITSVDINNDPNRRAVVQANAVGAAYFETMSIPVLAGREFTPADTPSAQQVAIVNEAFAKQYLAGRNPLGAVLSMAKSRTEQERFEIIGVVATTKHTSLGEAPTPVLYRPLSQEALPIPPAIQVRTDRAAAGMAATVRAAIEATSSAATVDVQTMQQVVDYSTYANKIGAALLGGLGALGLLLASIGLYGVLASSVNRRVREIGVRMALGASRADVLRTVLGRAMLLVGIGVVIGLTLAMIATRPLASFLSSRVSVTDPLTLALVVVALGLTALAAAFVPARRALNVDPITALRYE
ncbi:MAG: ABC transporter permease [Acidobacteriaceae bacterium]|nr:ABC transporter permease [Acidobacteriaceae bacterium]